MRRIFILIACVAIALAAGTVRSAAASAVHDTTNEQTDYVNFIALACENGGENIFFEGSLHSVNQITTDDTGSFHWTSHFNFQGVQGVGQTTGRQYEFASAGTFHTTFTNPGNSQNTVIRGRIIAPGALDNVFQDFQLHVTIAPDGRFVVFRVEDASGCRG